MERQTKSKNRYGRQMGALLLGAGLLLGHEHTSESAIAEIPLTTDQLVTKNIFLPFSYDALDSQMLAGVVRDPETNEYIIVKDDTPLSRRTAFHEGLDEPIAQLGRQSRAVNTILVTESNTENGQFDPKTKGITLMMSSSPHALSNVLKNPKVVPKAIDHEVTHALNKIWYEYLVSKETPQDRSLAAKISHVASTCIEMNRFILNDFIAENRELIAESFEKAGEGVVTSHSLTSVLAQDYEHSMRESAEAVRQDNPIIYDAQRLSDPTCQAVSISSIVDTISHQTGDTIGTEIISKMNLWSIQGQLESMAAKAFACINEGKALSELLHDTSPLIAGHPQDNPTEMASSIITTLVSNPNYFTQCMQKMPEAKKNALTAYMSAEINLMNYMHPELITILRRNFEVAEILDTYAFIDKSQ